MEFLHSKHLEMFLAFLEECQNDYKKSQEFQKKQELLTQDIMHKFELEDMSYHEMAALSKTLKENRQERRRYKNLTEILEPVIGWIESNKKSINQLTNLMGQVRKIEKKQQERNYMPRVMSWEDYHGGDTHEGTKDN